MKKLLQPYWLFLVVTLPQLILVFLYANAYVIIQSLLKPENIKFWGIFGGILIGLITFFTLYGIYKTLRNQQVSIWAGILLLLTYTPFLVALTYNMFENIFPRNVPRWMLFEHDLQIYIFTFLMPALAYGLFLIVLWLTPSEKEQSLALNFGITLAIPITTYAVATTIMELLRQQFGYRSPPDFVEYLFIATATIVPIVFLFFLIRSFYILLIKKSDTLQQYRLLWMIPIAIVFPLVGLALNNGLFNDYFGRGFPRRMFGNFTHPFFYLLAAFNGILLCLPDVNNKFLRLSVFIAKCFTFSYIIYFFLVFLPYLPLSVIIVVAFGLGFLMLSPLIIAVIQSQSLSKDFAYLNTHFNKHFLKIVGFLSFLVLPALLTANYWQDKQTLHQALDLITQTNANSNNEKIDTHSLGKTVTHIRKNKRRRGSSSNSSRQPYLSPFYQWLVLDNLTLSNKKIQHLEKIFLGSSKTRVSRVGFNIDTSSVKLDMIAVDSQFFPEEGYYKSWLHLDLTNQTTRQQEYATTFTLPEGAYISNYYLMIEGRKEYGILAEKKAAMWVYQQITSRRRDPGILYYLTGNKVAFRVFPFSSKENRQTGIELIHKEAFTLNFDKQKVAVGDSTQLPIDEHIELLDTTAIFISAAAKRNLPTVTRTPYYHFLIDHSKYKEKQIDLYINRIKKLLQQNLLNAENAQITTVNYRTKTFNLTDNWQEKLKNTDCEGGFFLEKALKEQLLKQYQHPSMNYPVFVAVSDTFSNAIFTKANLADFQMTFPESELFYELDQSGKLQAHSLIKEPLKIVEKDLQYIPKQSVFRYTHTDEYDTYLANNQQGGFAFIHSGSKVLKIAKITDNQWISGLELNALWKQQTLSPDNNNQQWLSLIKNSFAQHIMTPVTSFIAVENEAQKAALAAKQDQVLNAKESLDVGEANRMSSPSIWVVLLLFLGGLFWWRKGWW